MTYCALCIAWFPGPAQLSVLQATESWAGPGNKATLCTEETSIEPFTGISGDAILVAPGVSVEFTCTGLDGEFQPTWIVNRRVAVTEGDCYTSRLIRAQNPENVTATLTINGNRDTCRTFNVYCRLYRESQFVFVHNTTLVVQEG